MTEYITRKDKKEDKPQYITKKKKQENTPQYITKKKKKIDLGKIVSEAMNKQEDTPQYITKKQKSYQGILMSWQKTVLINGSLRNG
jgi:hypothetical protein